MSDRCCACDKELGFFDYSYEMLEGWKGYVLCDTCYRKYAALKHATGEQFAAYYENFRKMLENPKLPSAIKKHFQNLQSKSDMKKDTSAEDRMKREEEEKRLQNMLLTTGTHFEGYHVVKYVDVLCEEVFFKHRFSDSFIANMEDMGRAFSLDETEMFGASNLLARVRTYANEKLCRKAASIGANAVLGIDFESCVESGYSHVAISGTAVVIEKDTY